ncbi:hypothetical protein [Bradyrhizobium betae]|uniref:Uncharacterized protein n=1 Tax=Bradyrhizobium betae TaxID=244734 RepID=A0A4Q1ULJ4_9BRAD|nr:hypothetical protein [Bradyrhizobium betae]RXT36418.1 hypothetical protein B5V03_32665 [Bradyrhizobium betae]
MFPSASSNPLNYSDRSEVFHERDRSTRNVARNGTLLDIAEDEHPTTALRLREDAFNEDVLQQSRGVRRPTTKKRRTRPILFSATNPVIY